MNNKPQPHIKIEYKTIDGDFKIPLSAFRQKQYFLALEYVETY